MTKNPLPTIRIVAALLLLVLSGTWAQAQQQAQAAGEPIELTQRSKTVVIQPGRRISIHGPAGTAPIKGKLVTMADSIVVRPDNIRYQDRIKKVAVSDVRGITRRRIGWQVAAMYCSVQGLYVLGISMVAAFTVGGVVPTIAVLFLLFQSLYWIGLITLFFYLGYRRHNLPPWQVFRRGR